MPGVRPHLGAGRRVALPEVGGGVWGRNLHFFAVCLTFLPVFACIRLMELAETRSRRAPVSPPPLEGIFAVF